MIMDYAVIGAVMAVGAFVGWIMLRYGPPDYPEDQDDEDAANSRRAW